MRVLLVTNMYPSVRKPNYGVFVKDQVGSIVSERIHVSEYYIESDRGRLNYLVSVPVLRQLLVGEKVDIIHAHHSLCMPTILLARKLAKREQIPILLTLHEGDLMRKTVWAFTRASLVSACKRRLIDWADYGITVNPNLLTASQDRTRWRVIPCGVDTRLFRPSDRSVARNTIGVIHENRRIVFFPAKSVRDSNKGLHLLVEAIGRIGGARQFRILKGGLIPHSLMPAYFNACDVSVQLSEFEASPMVVKEAMACNCAFVSTDCGDVAALFRGRPGYYICKRNVDDIAEKIKLCVETGGFVDGRTAIVENHLTADGVAERVVQFYEEIVSATSRAG
jgi:teichuronic acid biosynthesis glycosyltransferase TuaC